MFIKTLKKKCINQFEFTYLKNNFLDCVLNVNISSL